MMSASLFSVLFHMFPLVGVPVQLATPPMESTMPTQVIESTVHSVRRQEHHVRTNELRTAVERRAELRRAKLAGMEDVTFSNDFGTFGISVPAGWTAHFDPQRAMYSDEDAESSAETRIAIFEHDTATLTSLSRERLVFPQFQHVAPIIAGYTDVNTISLLVETLGEPVPSLESLTAAYVQNLEFFGYPNTVVCDCDERVGGEQTTLAYSYPEENTVLVQTWTIIGDHVYLFTMLSDYEHYDAIYADFEQMISSFTLR